MAGVRYMLRLIGTFLLAIAPIALADATIYDELDKLTPNFTRVINTPGYNVTEEFPGTQLDWELSIRLYADVPGQIDGEDDRYISATRFFWDPPSSVPRGSGGSVDADSQFYYCISPLKYDDPEVKDSDEVDPRCNGVVSDACIQDLQKMTSTQSWCAILDWPDSCMDHSKDNSQLHMYGRVNITETPNSFVAFPSNRDGHKKGDTEDFRDALKTVWIVMTGFGEATLGGKLAETSEVNLTSGISCIRALSAKGASSMGNSKTLSIPSVSSLIAGLLVTAVWLLPSE
ncbi:unnamed protein product [Clonostachys chloroleuca]|uniref:Uncharacterized protein n=1 Tax=Clonostachys chloroleuca TaxID=1926264 RepID=A0AA35Q3R3_9HYPO|nr:unnamed protein product [Clonostachys chloroleuca]